MSWVVGCADDVEHGVLRGNKPSPASLFALIGKPHWAGPIFKEGDPRAAQAVSPLDPRIHFALVCGAKSCPPIRVYTPESLEAGLQAAASAFCEGSVQVDKAANKVVMSQILKVSSQFPIPVTPIQRPFPSCAPSLTTSPNINTHPRLSAIKPEIVKSLYLPWSPIVPIFQSSIQTHTYTHKHTVCTYNIYFSGESPSMNPHPLPPSHARSLHLPICYLPLFKRSPTSYCPPQRQTPFSFPPLRIIPTACSKAEASRYDAVAGGSGMVATLQTPRQACWPR
jgi:hypothetical protein